MGVFLLLLGVCLGAAAGWVVYYFGRREVHQLEEANHLLQQEKQIVLEFMHNLVEAIGEGVDREALCQRVVHAAVVSTGALSACLFELTPEKRLRSIAVEGLFPPHRPLPSQSKVKLTTRAKFIEQVLRTEEFEIGEGIVGQVAKERKGLLIANAEEDERIMKHDDPALRVYSALVMPVEFRDTLIGVLAVVNPADGEPFSDTDYSLAQSLAEQAALAIHNLTLMSLQIEKSKLDVELSLASSIQSMLLPEAFPEAPEIDISAVYRPAAKVGGDLYDVFELDEHRIGVAVADVSGKGIPASLLMAVCHNNLRHYARQGLPPAEVLGAMNAAMTVEMRQDMFITLVYAIVDIQERSIVIARAGHELPLFLHDDPESGVAETHLVGSEGMALGMVPDAFFRDVIAETSLRFEPGDVFVLYTDGVTEAVNGEGTEFSTSRLADAVKTLRHRRAKDLSDGILETLQRFSGGSAQLDDITLLTIKRT